MSKRMLVIAALLLAALSCQRRPLEEPSEYVNIKVDVNVHAVANVTTSVYNSHIPIPDLNTDMMRVLVYNPRSKALITQSFISAKSVDDEGNSVLSGDLNISYGTFDILIYNFDTPSVHVAGENNENTIVAYTEEIPPAKRKGNLPANKGSKTAKGGEVDEEGNEAADAEDETVSDDYYDNLAYNYEPDHFLVAQEQNLRVSPHDSVVVIKTTARTIVDTYYLQVHVTGMQYASQASAVITGLSPSNYFGIGQRAESPVAAVGFELRKSTDPTYPGENKDVLCALFNTFGKIPNVTSELHVTFNVIDTSGSLQQMDCSLDEIFESEDAVERHWLLVDKVFEIQKPEDPVQEQGGGFQPLVGDWEEEHSDVVI